MPDPTDPKRISAGRFQGGVFYDEDGFEIADTVQCCHCGQHFVFRRGKVEISATLQNPAKGYRMEKAIVRQAPGYCHNCDHLTCGGPNCVDCVPYKKKLDEYEAGKRRSLLFSDPNRPYLC